MTGLPTAGFSDVTAERGTSISVTDTSNGALLQVEILSNTVSDGNPADLVEITNNANQRFTTVDTTITASGISRQDSDPSSLDPGESYRISFECDSSQNSTTNLQVTADASGDDISIDGATNSGTVTYNCDDGGQAGNVNKLSLETGSTVGNNGGVEFVLSNEGSTDVTITDFVVNSTSTDAESIDEPDSGSPAQFFDNRTGALYSSIIDIGRNTPYDSTDTTIPAGEATEFTFEKFKPKQDGGGPPVSMQGESVTITLYFSDGSQRTFQLNVSS